VSIFELNLCNDIKNESFCTIGNTNNFNNGDGCRWDVERCVGITTCENIETFNDCLKPQCFWDGFN
jgi:hypothetical protein